MEEIKALMEFNWLYVILAVSALAVAVKSCFEWVDWFLDKIGIVTNRSLKKKETEDRINILEKHDKWQYDSICKILEKIDNLTDIAITREEKEQAKTVAMLRTQLYDMHSKFMLQGFVDNEGLKTFTELGAIYEDNGGNDIYHDKLKPEVIGLPIKK